MPDPRHVLPSGGTVGCFRLLLERWNCDRALRWPEAEAPKNCGNTVYRYDEELGKQAPREYTTVAE
jgi:hypothetical protein